MNAIKIFFSHYGLTTMHIRKIQKTFVWTMVGSLFVLLFIGLNIQELFAEPMIQSNGVGGARVWTLHNLSSSGSAIEPQMIVDHLGMIHAIWREENVDSFFYTRKEEGEWREPIPVELPFGTRRFTPDLRGNEATPLYSPYLLAGEDGRIYAFWIDQNQTLLMSIVLADSFEIFDRWSTLLRLDSSVVDFDVAVDANGDLYLSYIKGDSSAGGAAGVYYRRMDSVDIIWSGPEPLFTSAYYRAISSDYTNIDVAIAEDDAPPAEEGAEVNDGNVGVFVVGDNRRVEQVLALQSPDEGETWESPLLVDERHLEDSEDAIGPSKISVTVIDDEVHLIWLAGHETNCELYHQRSLDLGVTWEPPIIVPSDRDVCSEKFEAFVDENGLLFLLNYVAAQAYLQAWNGEEWGKPEEQPELTQFIDPATHRQVNFGCQQTAVIDGNNLLVIGCGSGTVSRDIWLLTRPLNDVTAWFPMLEDPVWQEPEPLFESSEQQVGSLLVLSRGDTVHAFWLAQNDNRAETNAEIYHSQWDGQVWSRIVPLLTLDSPHADRLQGGIDENGTFSLVWQNPETNTFFIKQVLEQNIRNPADWSEKRELIDADTLVSDVTLRFNEANVCHGVLAVPLNENRGLYWIQNEKSGESWTEPVLIFDAASAGWSMIDNPDLTQTTTGDLHVIMTQYDLQPEPVARALYYMRFREGGSTWTSPELISEGEIGWSEIVSLDEQVVLVMWQQFEDEGSQILFQQSFDNGRSWGNPFVFLEFATNDTFHPALVTDEKNNQLHLMYMVNDDGENRSFHEHLWQNGRWRVGDTYPLFVNLNERFNALTAAKTVNGHLVLLSSFTETPDGDEDSLNHLYSSQRFYDVPEDSSIPQAAQVPLETQEAEVTPSVESQQLLTSSVPLEDSPAQSDLSTTSFSQPGSPMTGILIGILPVILIIAGAILFSRLRVRFGDRQ